MTGEDEQVATGGQLGGSEEAFSMPPAILTVDEAATLLRCDRKTLYRAIRLGEVPGARRIGGVIRLHRDTLLAWLSGADGTVASTGHGRLRGVRGAP